MNDDTNKRTSTPRTAFNCAAIMLVTLALAVAVVCGGLYIAFLSMNTFDSYRGDMCIREDLVIEDPDFTFSPGFDAAMWCKFDVKADSIDEVFDKSQVDTAEFREMYEIKVAWIKDDWWDVDDRELTGGEVELSGDSFMRVGYEDNGDGTLTVYIFWFEV